MKNLFAMFALLACFTLTTTAVSAQSMEFINKSNCNITVQLAILDANCDLVCVGAAIPVAAETEIQIPWSCGVLFQLATSSFGLRVTDGSTVVSVGTGCGLPTTSNYDDCEGMKRTLEIYSPLSAVIY